MTLSERTHPAETYVKLNPYLMMLMKKLNQLVTAAVLGVSLFAACWGAGGEKGGLTPLKPVPSAGQLAWHDMEMYAFIHFTINTFTGKEWGYGDEKPELFNPSDFDADDLVKTLADTGFKGVVLTCKHHDGFCLWPTKTTRHSVAASPWRQGKGDVVKEISRACRKYGVRFGIYLSPWDRNAASYGTPDYIRMYRQQLKELATGYGPVFLAWFDGANGGDGYYGGAREKRSIDRSRYYQWKKTWGELNKIQPRAVIFSDVGPGARWVGNESGYAGYPCWATYTPVPLQAGMEPAPGTVRYQLGTEGTVDGRYWIPAEVDVSIRPGWFWHKQENSRVRTPENLLKLYFDSVGRGANLNLNVPPDRRGRIHEEDKKSLAGFRALLNELYSRNFASGARAESSSSWKGHGAEQVLDRKRATYWAAAPEDKNPCLILKFPQPAAFDVIRLAEPVQLGQRVRRFRVDVREKGQWVKWTEGSSIGARVLLKGRPVTTDEVRVALEEYGAVPALCEVSLWKYPVVLNAPAVKYDRDGRVTLVSAEGVVTRYATDGTAPGPQSAVYGEPFLLPAGGTVKAVSEYRGRTSSVTAQVVPVPTRDWKVTAGERGAAAPELAIDGNPATLWHTHAARGEMAPPQALEIDMGRPVSVSAVIYTPRTDSAKGTIDQYAVYLSADGEEWGAPAAEGEFSNIRANPVLQRIDLKAPVKARYLRFTGKRVVEGSHVVVAELGVLEK